MADLLAPFYLYLSAFIRIRRRVGRTRQRMLGIIALLLLPLSENAGLRTSRFTRLPLLCCRRFPLWGVFGLDSFPRKQRRSFWILRLGGVGRCRRSRLRLRLPVPDRFLREVNFREEQRDHSHAFARCLHLHCIRIEILVIKLTAGSIKHVERKLVRRACGMLFEVSAFRDGAFPTEHRAIFFPTSPKGQPLSHPSCKLVPFCSEASSKQSCHNSS